MLEQVTLEEIIKSVENSDLKKMFCYYERILTSRQPALGSQEKNYDIFDLFYSKQYFAQLAVKSYSAGKNQMIYSPIKLSLTVSMQPSKIVKEFNQLYNDLINSNINGKKEQNPYKESISMVYNPNSRDIEKLKKNMNTIYNVTNKYENLRKNYLK